MTKTRKFKKEYASELLAIADHDLQAAKVLLDAKVKRKENIFFHIEQSIEKCLKAVLCKHSTPVPLIHELQVLIDHLPKGVSPPRVEEISDLTQFATIRRYEEGRADFSSEEINAAYQLGQQILDWAKKA